MLVGSVNRLRRANRQMGASRCADERAFSKSGRRESGGSTGGHRQAGSLPGKPQAASQDFPIGSYSPHTLLREGRFIQAPQALGYSLSWPNPGHSRFWGAHEVVNEPSCSLVVE
ncbi:hypothetical protein CORC01_05445 [Colletotrichum orchidophilum]|uniref:Uncharacterized protein n=1 Tax=Colletotrichum orchidophilum TaxID=1209926 RepID=A0A1G4BCN7_9PEZI|nr:uncharacterized protein CORC01_05445 [Colletotrichum orchidophilum]OHE99164.1 hypothetical protein CORC01_05445 [Colletotrichum orchidophilum]